MNNMITVEISPNRQFNAITCILQLSVETRARPYHAHIEINIPDLYDKIAVMKNLANELYSLLLQKRDQFQDVKWKS